MERLEHILQQGVATETAQKEAVAVTKERTSLFPPLHPPRSKEQRYLLIQVEHEHWYQCNNFKVCSQRVREVRSHPCSPLPSRFTQRKGSSFSSTRIVTSFTCYAIHSLVILKLILSELTNSVGKLHLWQDDVELSLRFTKAMENAFLTFLWSAEGLGHTRMLEELEKHSLKDNFGTFKFILSYNTFIDEDPF